MTHKPPKSPAIFSSQKRQNFKNRAAKHLKKSDFIFEHVENSFLDRLSYIKKDFSRLLQIDARTKIADKISLGKNQLKIIQDSAFSLKDNQKNFFLCAAEETLPFKEKTFDLIISALCQHAIDDVPGHLIQIRKTLEEDGLFLGALFGSETLPELRQALLEAEIENKNGAANHFLPLANKQQMSALMQRAGFALPVVDSEKIIIEYKNLNTLLEDLKNMGEQNCLFETAPNISKNILQKTKDIYQKKFTTEDKKYIATFEIIYLIGWAPHPSQQQPQKRGTADIPLAQALDLKKTDNND